MGLVAFFPYLDGDARLVGVFYGIWHRYPKLYQQLEYLYIGAVAKLGGEPRTLLSSSPGQHYGPACLDILEDPVDDHRVRVRLPVGKHRALPFPQ